MHSLVGGDRTEPALASELRRLTEEVATQTRITLEQWRTHGWPRQDLPLDTLVDRADEFGADAGS